MIIGQGSSENAQMKQLKYTADLTKMKQLQSFQADSIQLAPSCVVFSAVFVFSPTRIEFLDEKEEIKLQWPYGQKEKEQVSLHYRLYHTH